MISAGIRELKNNLSQYVRRIEDGERVAVTAHGRIIAELGPPSADVADHGRSQYDRLVAAGIARPPLEVGDPLKDWPDLHLPSGTAAQLIDEDRGEE
jgi:antitoxin (DNA-binding transcriptional repressor) of toxin-antitoxin stability system